MVGLRLRGGDKVEGWLTRAWWLMGREDLVVHGAALDGARSWMMRFGGRKPKPREGLGDDSVKEVDLKVVLDRLV